MQVMFRQNQGFNRTFMELKYEYQWEWYNTKRCFNRTFMELKFTWILCISGCDKF